MEKTEGQQFEVGEEGRALLVTLDSSLCETVEQRRQVGSVGPEVPRGLA